MNNKPELPVVEKAEEMPDYWFQKLLRSVREGDFGEADRSQKELRRLGWDVKRTEAGK